MAFGQDYAALLKYFDRYNKESGDWTPFFNGDMSAQLAVAAAEDVDVYRTAVKGWFDYLNQRENLPNTEQLKNTLGFLYGAIGTLASRLDATKERLPSDAPLKAMLDSLIRNQLAPSFARLIGYYRGGHALGLVNDSVPSPELLILHGPFLTFGPVLGEGLSIAWVGENSDWTSFLGSILPDQAVYGELPGGSGLSEAEKIFIQINHAATYALFTSVFDQFLKVFARFASEARLALEETLTAVDTHEPHYALFLAFLRLFDYAREDANTLTGRHLDFYYREILRLREKPAEPGHVHLLIELAKQAATHEFKSGDLFKAGKDDAGRDAYFSNDSEFVANQAKVSALKTVYCEGVEKNVVVDALRNHEGRVYASPVADSADGLGAALTSVSPSWSPFYIKTYLEGALKEIDMPEAELGFAVASHYLLMAEGSRWVAIVFDVQGYSGDEYADYAQDIRCLLTTEKSWLEKEPLYFGPNGSASEFLLVLSISGADAPITPYSTQTHKYDFDTDLPVLLVKLKHDDARKYAYPNLRDVTVSRISVYVDVANLKSLAVSNDYGQVDTSKPFQPFGPFPVSGNSLIIGSKEVFQKNLIQAAVSVDWLVAPVPYGTSPNVTVGLLSEGSWSTGATPLAITTTTTFPFPDNLPASEGPDFGQNEFYGTASRQGFAKLTLDAGFGNAQYQLDLINYLVNDGDQPTSVPAAPSIGRLSLAYFAAQIINLDSASGYEDREARFFHLSPFGQAEQHPFLKKAAGLAADIYWLPQIVRPMDGKSDAGEFYIGITGLSPPQNLALLIEVADGTANPLAAKPKPHVSWSWLRKNEWVAFTEGEIQDATGELLNSGIITFSVARDASDDNSILPAGLFWLRASVQGMCDAVCQFRLVAAQALQATFSDRDNSPSFSATPLQAGTISKLDQPDAAVKSISQPFASFGGRGAEAPMAFYTRISERLRHKDRAIALWDYERIVLEAFPKIYKVKCLNHTRYEPSETGDGIYRELAPGHVTIVTIPDLKFHNLRDPLRPCASLGLLQEIEAFVSKRSSCFAKVHARNPQFDEVRARFKVRLREGFDQGYCIPLLQQAITRFLSPWAFSDGGSPSFGGKIYKSVLINFVEDQPCVDYVTDFQLFLDVAEAPPGSTDLDEIEGARAISVLVSAPGAKHEIAVIDPAAASVSGEACGCET